MNVKRGTSQPKSRRSAKTTPNSRRSLLLERLEKRWLMAGNVGTGFTDEVFPQNINAAGVITFKFAEREASSGRALNDSIATAELLPLGTASGKQSKIDVTGFLPAATVGGLTGQLPEDVDYYAFDLQAGDILDLAGIGAIGGIDVFFANGRRWFAIEDNQVVDPDTQIAVYPGSSPLMTEGNAVGAQVVPTTGRYYLRLASNGATSNYTLGLRVYRPVMEQAPIGSRQRLFLDFDGATLPNSVFTPGLAGTTRVPSFFDSLELINLEEQDEDRFIDEVISRLTLIFNTVGVNGGNGFFNTSGVAGQYGFEVINSRDVPDPGDDPYTTKVYIGGTEADINLDGLLGISQSIDVGNFDPSEILLVPVEPYEAAADGIDRSNAASLLDVMADMMAGVLAHELGHSIGLWHTDNANRTASVSDAGGTALSLNNIVGLGLDEIYGTADDVIPSFATFDRFFAAEGVLIGDQYVAASMAWAMSTGKAGGAVTGTVFVDTNRDGVQGTGETGLAGVTVFNDKNSNGVLDAGETSTTSTATGTYSLAIGAGTQRVVAVPPTNYRGSSAAKTVTVSAAGATGVDLGLSQIQAGVTGTKWADLDGDGFRDTNEPGIQGVFIYIDLDQDARIDIGEPRATTDANGNFSLNFPGPGTYRVREVVEPGFVQTLPGPAANNEYIVTFDGTPVSDLNFANLPSLDFGDLPNTYLTQVGSGGASHGLLAGLSIGGAPDRDLDGVPTTDARGDDLAGSDDEDGVTLLGPIGPNAAASFSINLNNTTGQTGYLRAWFDLNQNGQFETNELQLNDVTATGIITRSINIPGTIDPTKPLYARFRYSLTAGLSAAGQANAGEVEDYAFTVQATPTIAVRDTVTITNDGNNPHFIDVLANDFLPANGTIQVTSKGSIGSDGQPTRGVVDIARDPLTNAGIGINYTPPVGFVGRDSFSYTATLSDGRSSTVFVDVTVSFLSSTPVAIDDTFNVAQGSTNVALNVLDNDLASLNGGLIIISATQGSQGGRTALDSGSQTIRYSPRAGFTGTEEFTYSISDSAGNVSDARVTVSSLPGSQDDDLVSYTVRFFDPDNPDVEVTDVQAGDQFLARVYVQDLRAVVTNQGVFSAFLDLLYDSELTSVVPDSSNGRFDFDITFGQQFQSAGTTQDVTTGDATTPGLINEVGSTRPFTAVASPNEGPIELFTVKMQAVAPGTAIFAANPADLPESETTLFNLQSAITAPQQRLGISEINILPSGQQITRAIDDSFLTAVAASGQPATPVDSNGRAIVAGSAATLRVVENDVLGLNAQGVRTTIDTVTLSRSPGLGTAFINSDFSITYTPPNAPTSGTDSFSYTLQTSDGVRSTATVNVAFGAAFANDQLDITLRTVNGDGEAITGPIPVNTRFGVQIIVDDLRTALQASPLGVYAAFADILYNSGIVTPSNTITGDAFNFDVVFSPIFGILDPVTGQVLGAFGNADTPGLIDELGSFVASNDPNNIPPGSQQGDPVLLATLFFDAKAQGTAVFKTNPADALPQRESLFFTPDTPVDPSLIRFGTTSIVIEGPAGEAAIARQNALTPTDVNDDGRVTPIDALLVINQVAAAKRAEGEATGSSQARRFSDVTGDGKVTPLDALHVINAIAARTRTTPPTINTPPNVTPAITPETYQRLTELQNRMTKAFTGYAPVIVSGSRVAEGEAFGNQDNEEEDYLDLLARDLSTQIK